jgi:hypothetical protein
VPLGYVISIIKTKSRCIICTVLHTVYALPTVMHNQTNAQLWMTTGFKNKHLWRNIWVFFVFRSRSRIIFLAWAGFTSECTNFEFNTIEVFEETGAAFLSSTGAASVWCGFAIQYTIFFCLKKCYCSLSSILIANGVLK